MKDISWLCSRMHVIIAEGSTEVYTKVFMVMRIRGMRSK